MLAGIIIVSVIALTAFVFMAVSFIKFILHFKEREIRNKNVVIFAVSLICFTVLGGLNTVLIIKHVYDNRQKIIEAAGGIIGTAIDKTAEYAVRGAIATASTYRKLVNKAVIKQFKGLDITYSSSRFEIDGDKKIHEIELVLDNKMPKGEDIYVGNLVQNNYLIACDTDDFVYPIIPQDGDSGYIEDREYTKYGKILPGKSRHKILVVTAKDIELAYMQFLDRRIDIK